MFEFKTAIHAIPQNQLYLYYFIVIIIYLLFFRNFKLTNFSLFIAIAFNQGILFSLFPVGGRQFVEITLVILSAVALMKANFKFFSLKDKKIIMFFVFFTFFFYLKYLVYGVSLLYASFQYVKFYIPFAFYFGLKYNNNFNKNNVYYADLFIRFIKFQVVFSVVKILVIGLREDIIGSVASTGGSMSITVALTGIILLWAMSDCKIKRKDMYMYFLVLLVPIASNKRAIWFLYPIIILLMASPKLNFNNIRKLTMLLLLIPLILYFGFRLNPSLNPDSELWGRFDLRFSVDYMLSYSGVSEEKIESDYAQGRWGSTIQIIKNILIDPLQKGYIIGLKPSVTGRVDSEEFKPEDYGLKSGTMISGLGRTLYGSGYGISFFLIMMFLNMISQINNKKVKKVLYFYFLWELIFYTGNMMLTKGHTVLWVIIIVILQIRYDKNKNVPIIQ